MRAHWAMAMAVILLALLAGCGQKGPLYLPGNEEAAETYDPSGEALETEPETEPETDQDNDTGAGDDTSTTGARE